MTFCFALAMMNVHITLVTARDGTASDQPRRAGTLGETRGVCGCLRARQGARKLGRAGVVLLLGLLDRRRPRGRRCRQRAPRTAGGAEAEAGQHREGRVSLERTYL